MAEKTVGIMFILSNGIPPLSKPEDICKALIQYAAQNLVGVTEINTDNQISFETIRAKHADDLDGMVAELTRLFNGALARYFPSGEISCEGSYYPLDESGDPAETVTTPNFAVQLSFYQNSLGLKSLILEGQTIQYIDGEFSVEYAIS